MKFITITGIDKSGKTTLINAFMNSTNHENYVIDRSPDTFHFFNVLQNRLNDNSQCYRYNRFNERFKEVLDLAILLTADTSDIKQRFINTGEPDLVGNLSMHEHQKEIRRYFFNANYNNILELNTSKYSIKECVELIQERIKCL